MMTTQYTVTSENIFARARPQKVSVTEAYSYHQELSANPFISQLRGDAHRGRISAHVPYDGYQYFTRNAIEDAQEQIEQLQIDDPDARLEATIGHLAFVNIRDTRRKDGSPLAALHDAIPLRVPVRCSELKHTQRYSGVHEAVLNIDYFPPDAGNYPFPIKIDFRVVDPEDQPVTPDELQIRPGKKSRAGFVPEQIIRQPAFSSELWLILSINLLWPRRSKAEPSAVIKRVSLTWPTITSLAPSSLRFTLGDKKYQMLYNPEKGCLEWVTIPLDRVDDADPGTPTDSVKDKVENQDGPPASNESGAEATPPNSKPDDADSTTGPEPIEDSETSGDDNLEDEEHDDLEDGTMWRMRSAEMQLIVEQPGQLRNETTLDGEIEVEVGDELYSGMDARLFSAAGKRQPRGTLSLKTTLHLSFRVYLEDEFNRRDVSATYTLHFDEVVPEEGRVDDIMAALRDRGFSLETFPKQGADDSPRWFIQASRDEGPNEILLLLVVRGRRYTTRRRAETPGWHRYVSKFESGDIRVTIYGRVPRDNRELTSEVNELRKSLSTRFSHMQAQR
ncbi:hypothetical protein [Pseudonocardia charpentierae]|uniref:Uncharacterized protein n=1 Tax=Pseudonocardia charpentierae TaxID=3075545 RepID=A0ABU2N993_9PSEU|nr:hypothetical protein [Pseudonocardia sp. DSM 45834]MDT0350305.1 hypothetical protein [Pseudonocardia sp. DSM 45834]